MANGKASVAIKTDLKAGYHPVMVIRKARKRKKLYLKDAHWRWSIIEIFRWDLFQSHRLRQVFIGYLENEVDIFYERNPVVLLSAE